MAALPEASSTPSPKAAPTSFTDRPSSATATMTGGQKNGYTTLTTQDSSGNFVTNVYKPKDWRKQWGFGIGGPIIKDRLFWFYAYDQSSRNFPGTARVGTPLAFYAAPLSSLPPGVTCANIRTKAGQAAFPGGTK